MSLETWKAEFYPIEARDVRKQDALAHSLRKWTGLLAKNLKKHAIRFFKGRLHDGPTDEVRILGGDNCALCQHWCNESETNGWCPDCPLVLSGHLACPKSSSVYAREYNDDFRHPARMVRVLREALAWQKRQRRRK